MRRLFQAALLAGLVALSWPLAAQQGHSCTNYTIVVGSPEDKLMLAVNGASDPNAKVSLLEKFAQEHSDSNYLPCVEQLLTRNYLTLKQYNQAIATGQKAVAAGYLDVSFVENLLQAYMESSTGGTTPFDLIAQAAPHIQAEANIPKSYSESDAQYEAAKKSASQQVKNDTAYMVYAFFHFLSGVTDPTQQIKVLDQFSQAYPEVAKEQAGRLNYQYALAYARANQPEKADEYSEKTIAADPSNIEALNLVSYDYALRRRTNQAKAEEYAQRVLTLVPTSKKPEDVSAESFKTQQDTQEGMAHLTLGFLDLQKTGASHRTAGAIKQLREAVDLLKANPELQGEAYYFLGYSYEAYYPPEHRQAIAALQHAVSISNSMQGQARELMAKIRRAGQ
jgi:tetratricopeptide (TPR) repeat protein